MHSTDVSKATRESGFTLIELSIVLVIIGLIVGGVLVGQNLIQAAQIRATLTQIEHFNTEVNTFRTKYNGIPGDLSASLAGSYGLFQLTTAGTGMGDGNGIIEDGNGGAGGANKNTFAGEISTFWRQLSDANLVEGSFGSVANALLKAASGVPTGVIPDTTSGTLLSMAVPVAKLGSGLGFDVFSGNGFNYYALLPITSISASGVITVGTAGISPITATNMDTKVDDGEPNTGIVRALALGVAPIAPSSANTLFSPYGMTAPSVAATATVGDCTIGTGI
ncbi:MAG: prepilin-type N-terminal cleavage/methylation domain-containing protein, partial [Pseudomonadota bacterium]|nr:prepilin-type N-terminal cleavage/methylation domain-containing protein [Pseudomonadota bacterium]